MERIKKKYIVIKFNIEGIHKWSNCDIEEVDYLKHPHRHQFYITIQKEVSHNDREIEIIKFKRTIIQWLKVKFYSKHYKCLWFGNRSCEDIATELLNKWEANTVEVLEDNENGAIIC